MLYGWKSYKENMIKRMEVGKLEVGGVIGGGEILINWRRIVWFGIGGLGTIFIKRFVFGMLTSCMYMRCGYEMVGNYTVRPIDVEINFKQFVGLVECERVR